MTTYSTSRFASRVHKKKRIVSDHSRLSDNMTIVHNVAWNFIFTQLTYLPAKRNERHN
jgi:hypothetical protein